MPIEQIPSSEDCPPGLASPATGGNAAVSGPPQRGELPPPVTGGQAWPKSSACGRVSDFWALVGCNAIVFVSSVCIMVLELTASRLIAQYVGQSLYTWTSVIGVVLAGISIGNYLGGWLADRYPPQRILARLFLASGVLTLSVLFLNGWAANANRPAGTTWQAWVMLVVAWVFFLP
ncbi:MAG TPA: fused MFS/spermidine synthase, partial [Planctomycetaceae bacterium]|nr:fused MFS/spermidine synthase [Planctomycetaceae bacterium]